jgi:hypothetical protein
MVERALLSSGDETAVSTASAVLYGALAMSAFAGTAAETVEARAQITHRGVDGSIDRLSVRARNNARTTASQVALRVNSASADPLVVIGAGITGTLTDLTDLAPIQAGDVYGYELTLGSGAGNLNISSVAARMTLDGQSTVPVAGQGSVSIATASTTRYAVLPGALGALNTTESSSDLRAPAAQTIANLACYVSANARTTTTTLKSRKNAADGAQSVSIGAGLTGWFENTTNTDSLAADDRFCAAIVTGAGTETLTFTVIGFLRVYGATANQHPVYGNATTTFTAPSGSARYGPAIGRLTALTAEIGAQFALPLAATWSKLGVTVTTNASGSALVLSSRINGVSGNQAVTIGAGLTGAFVDASNSDVVASGGLINFMTGTGANNNVTIRRVQSLLSITTTGELTQSVGVGIGLSGGASRQASLRRAVGVGLGLRGTGGLSKLQGVTVDIGLGLAAAGGRVLAARAAVSAGLGIAPTSGPSKVLNVAVSVGLGLVGAAVMAGRRAIMNAVSVAAGNRLRLIAPGETQEFSNDWDSWLGDDTIESSSWAISPEGPVLGSAFFAGTETTVLVSEAELGGMWRLTNTVTTATGRVGEKGYVLRGAPK